MAAASKQIEQYGRNANAAESRLNLEEAALASVNNTLSRVRELALSADGAKSDGDRAIIAGEIGGRLAELYDAGNSQDAAGEYLFAGSRADTRPFERGEPVAFKGNEVGRELRIGGSRTVVTGNSGIEAFLRVPTGNGGFATDMDAGNTGTATISTGSVTDRAAFRNVDYTIEFTSATSFDVKNAGGTTVLAAQPFASGEPITFEGITTSIDGTAASGDEFHIRAGETPRCLHHGGKTRDTPPRVLDRRARQGAAPTGYRQRARGSRPRHGRHQRRTRQRRHEAAGHRQQP